MASPSDETSIARVQILSRLKSVVAVVAVIALLCGTSFYAMQFPTGNIWKLLLLLSWCGIAALILLLPTPSLQPTLSKFIPIRIGYLGMLCMLMVANMETTSEVIVGGLATALGVCMALGEQVLLGLKSGRGAPAFNFPGLKVPPPVLQLTKSITFCQLGFLGFGAITVVLNLAPIWWLLLGLPGISLIFIRAISIVRRQKAIRSTERSIRSLIDGYAPEFAIYTARPDDASYQVSMWLPYLKRTGKKFIIVTRAETPSLALAELTDAPVVMRTGIAGLDDIIVPSLTTVFYVNASSGNGAMVRFNHLTHVYLGHGDSDKAPSYNPTHAMYDRIYAAGLAATRRYAKHGVRIDQSKFDIVGRPQLESITKATAAIPASPVVLYAPTWRGHVEETFLHSLPVATRIVTSLLARGNTVIFRPHPFSYDYPADAAIIAEVQDLLGKDAAATGRRHLWGSAAEIDLDIIGCMNRSDLMISDVSSVVSDYLYSGKPFAMVAVNVPLELFREHYPIARAAYLFDTSLSTLDQVLTAMSGFDPMSQQRQELRVEYLGNFPAEKYAEAFVSQARFTIDNGVKATGDASSQAKDNAERQNQLSVKPTSSKSGMSRSTSNGTTARKIPSPKVDRRSLKNVVARVIKNVLPTGLALLALLGAAVTNVSSVWFFYPALLTMAFYSYIHRRCLKNHALINKTLGSMELARSIIAATLAFGLISLPNNMAAALGTGLVFLSVVLEGQIVAAWKTSGLQSINLPGYEKTNSLSFAHGWAGLINAVILTTLLIICYLVPTANFVPLSLGALSIVVTGFVWISGLRHNYQTLILDSQLPDLLSKVAPRFCVYFGSGIGITYQLGMWVPYLDRLGIPYIVVTRNLKMMRAAAKVTNAPVIYRKTLASLEPLLVPSMTTAFYVNNAVKNTHLIERRELHHVWLNHGDSEKPACFNPVHAIYDEIFTAGQAGIDRYARHGVMIPTEKFVIVGRPQVENIKLPTSYKPARTILYAPTWRGPYADTAVYSLPLSERIVEGLLERGCTVIFRAHPLNYDFADARTRIQNVIQILQEDTQASGRNHVFGPAAESEMSFVDCFNASDGMISDVSAMISDYLYSTKPFAVVAVKTDRSGLYQSMPATASGYVIEETLSNFSEVLDSMLDQDPLASRRSEVKEYYLGSFSGENYADGFLNAARQRINRAQGAPIE